MHIILICALYSIKYGNNEPSPSVSGHQDNTYKDPTYNDFTYNINKCDLTNMFLFSDISKVIYN